MMTIATEITDDIKEKIRLKCEALNMQFESACLFDKARRLEVCIRLRNKRKCESFRPGKVDSLAPMTPAMLDESIEECLKLLRAFL